MHILKKSVVIVAAVFLLSGYTNARAATFGDSAAVWKGLESLAIPGSGDTHGIPDLLGGSFNFGPHHTPTSITLNYQNPLAATPGYNATLWNSVAPRDWFFDIVSSAPGAPMAFDYVLHRNSDGQYHLYYKANQWAYGTQAAYQYNNGAFANYESSSSSYGGPRWYHPVAANAASLDGATDLGAVSFSGWASYADSTATVTNGLGPVLTATWDFTSLTAGWNLDQYRGQKFTYAFALSCANDVLYGESQVPTPEPGTMLLMGAGALGAAFMRRRAKA